MKYIFCICLALITLSASSQNHNSILPQPKKIVYGNGQFVLKGTRIGFLTKPSSEDKFAATELSGILSKITSGIIMVRESGISGCKIIFERTGDNNPLPVAGGKTGPDLRESYNIRVTAKNIRITAKSSVGLFYGVQTLRQMIEGSGDNAFLPEVEIEDWPSLVYRGFMMDMSHFHLPKIEEIKKQIDFLSFWKGNIYLFYSEASIELDGYPLLMADARFTKEQVKEIIDYAKARHIDVIPHMELYGHLHDLFRLEHYSDLAVLPYGGEFMPDDPRVKPLLNDWISQISQLFPSPFFHIGCDETWRLEFISKKLDKNPEDIYLKMLDIITDLVEKQGKIPLVYGDMLQKYPSIIPKVSHKIIAVPWHYTPLSDDKYEQLLSPFTKSGISMIVQGAIWNWEWVVPQFEVSFLNANALISAGKKYNAVGFINSGWTDDSQTLMRMGFPDIAYGAIASWQDEPVDRENFFIKYAQAQYPTTLANLIGKAYKSLAEAESLIRKAVGPTDVAFWANPFTAESLKMIASNKDNLHHGRLADEEAQIYIRSALKYNIDTVSLTAMLAGAQMLDYIGLKYIYAGEIGETWKQVSENMNPTDFYLLIQREMGSKIHSKTEDMMDAIFLTKEIFHKAWLNEYTSFRLDIALNKYDQEFNFWWRFQRSLLNLKYHEGEALPTLESLVGLEK